MTLKKIQWTIAMVLGLAMLAPALALAQTYGAASVDTNASVNAGGVSASTSASASANFTATETKAKGRGDAEVDRRIAALNDLNVRVQAMQRVSDSFKQSLNANITAEISSLTTLKAKLDADSDSATLKADLQSITQGYRIFALVLPQGRIAAAADRVAIIVNMMGTLGGKLQARVQAAAATGADVTSLNAALADMSAKLNDAQVQAQAAITASASLQPDGGDAAKMAANTTALKQARADIVAAQKDLVAARKDVDTIVKGLKNVSVHASSTTQTTVTP